MTGHRTRTRHLHPVQHPAQPHLEIEIERHIRVLHLEHLVQRFRRHDLPAVILAVGEYHLHKMRHVAGTGDQPAGRQIAQRDGLHLLTLAIGLAGNARDKLAVSHAQRLQQMAVHVAGVALAAHFADSGSQ